MAWDLGGWSVIINVFVRDVRDAGDRIGERITGKPEKVVRADVRSGGALRETFVAHSGARIHAGRNVEQEETEVTEEKCNHCFSRRSHCVFRLWSERLVSLIFF